MNIGQRAKAKAEQRDQQRREWFERASILYLDALMKPPKTYTLDGRRMTREAWLVEVHRQLVNEIKRQQRRERAVKVIE